MHIQRDEIETVIVLPVVESCVDFVCVLVEQFGVEQLLGGRTYGAIQLSEESKVVSMHGLGGECICYTREDNLPTFKEYLVFGV